MPKFGAFDAAVAAWVRAVPRGQVATYGQVATGLGSPRAARAVGDALFRLLEPSVPWWRIVNARGEISEGGHLQRPELQRRLLEAEGVEFDAHARIDLGRFRHVRRGATPVLSPAVVARLLR